MPRSSPARYNEALPAEEPTSAEPPCEDASAANIRTATAPRPAARAIVLPSLIVLLKGCAGIKNFSVVCDPGSAIQTVLAIAGRMMLVVTLFNWSSFVGTEPGGCELFKANPSKVSYSVFRSHIRITKYMHTHTTLSISTADTFLGRQSALVLWAQC